MAFDPLDGSSIVDTNFAVGSIYGVWEGSEFLGRTGREQVASVIAVYGPKCTLAVSVANRHSENKIGNCVILALKGKVWQVINNNIKIADEGNVFAPGNMKAAFDNKN